MLMQLLKLRKCNIVCEHMKTSRDFMKFICIHKRMLPNNTNVAKKRKGIESNALPAVSPYFIVDCKMSIGMCRTFKSRLRRFCSLRRCHLKKKVVTLYNYKKAIFKCVLQFKTTHKGTYI